MKLKLAVYTITSRRIGCPMELKETKAIILSSRLANAPNKKNNTFLDFDKVVKSA